jgi:hypothetical protein
MAMQSHLIELLGDPQGRMLVGDPRQNGLRARRILGHQQGGKRRDRAGQRALLVALGLICRD